MLYRFKGMAGFEPIERGALREFLKLYARKDGSLSESLEIIHSGLLERSGESGDDRYPWVFSTFDNDRYDERIDPAGWDLSAYQKNPVVLWAHNHFIPAIGLAEAVSAGDKLTGTIRFNDQSFDEFGWGIGERVKHGIIRAGSVGLRVLEIEFVDRRKNPDETSDLIYRRQELLEFSICNVPANPFALRTENDKDTGTAAPTSTTGSSTDRKGFSPFLGQQNERRQ